MHLKVHLPKDAKLAGHVIPNESHSGPENLKSLGQKTHEMKSINFIEFFGGEIFHFLKVIFKLIDKKVEN